MGLDMYLIKRTYVHNWDHKKDKYKITVKLNNKIVSGIKPERITNIIEEVAYWRKANQIHKWFIENVQNGVDDCGEYYVEKEKLSELVRLCRIALEKAITIDDKVKNGQRWTKESEEWQPILQDGKVCLNKNELAEILPTSDGFFFGSTDYDEYYLDDLKNTVEMIEPLLQEDGDFYYHSSW